MSIRIFLLFLLENPLVGIRKSAHTRHNTENVVVDREDLHLTGIALGVESERESRVIDAAEVAGTRGLVLLRLESKGVHVDVLGGHTGVVLVGLHKAEVRTGAVGHTVVTVEEDLRRSEGLGEGDSLIRGRGGVLPGGLVSTNGVHGEVEVILLILSLLGAVHPDKLLNGVVEVHAELLSAAGGTVVRGDGLITGELELLNEHLVGYLGEAATLIGVKVDVIDPERAVSNLLVASGNVTEDEVLNLLEINVDLDLVVLEGNEGKSKSGVAVEEENKGNVVGTVGGGILGGTVVHTNHFLVTGTLLLGEGELRPDFKPLGVVLVNTLTTDLEFDGLHESVTNGVDVLSTRIRKLGELDLEVHIGNKVTIAANGGGNLATEVSGTVEGLLNGFNSEVCVTTVHNLEESNLGVTRKENILSTVSDELHKTSAHFFVLLAKKKISKYETP